MLQKLLINVIFVTFLFSLGIANSYEERTVYTQALLTIRYKPDSHPINKEPKKFVTSGKYGKDSPKESAKGVLYHAPKNIDWCKYFGPMVVIKSPWIAVIPQGNCSEEIKIKLAQRYNASAVIIYNDSPRGQSDVMDDRNGDIVSVMLAHQAGLQLAKIILKEAPTDSYCEILVGTHYVDRRWKVSRTSVLFVLVSFILLMCISLAWLVFYYVQRFRHIYRNDRKEKQLLNAAKKAISKLKTISFQSANREEDDSCAVCLECYKDGENLRVLPCKHEFHKTCIDPWLLTRRTCPMCKSNILKSLGVEIPDNGLSHDLESREHNEMTTHDTTDVQVLPPGPSVFTPTTQTQAWPETPPPSYSSSSVISESDSDGSTVALVFSVQRV